MVSNDCALRARRLVSMKVVSELTTSWAVFLLGCGVGNPKRGELPDGCRCLFRFHGDVAAHHI